MGVIDYAVHPHRSSYKSGKGHILSTSLASHSSSWTSGGFPSSTLPTAFQSAVWHIRSKTPRFDANRSPYFVSQGDELLYLIIPLQCLRCRKILPDTIPIAWQSKFFAGESSAVVRTHTPNRKRIVAESHEKSREKSSCLTRRTIVNHQHCASCSIQRPFRMRPRQLIKHTLQRTRNAVRNGMWDRVALARRCRATLTTDKFSDQVSHPLLCPFRPAIFHLCAR